MRTRACLLIVLASSVLSACNRGAPPMPPPVPPQALPQPAGTWYLPPKAPQTELIVVLKPGTRLDPMPTIRGRPLDLGGELSFSTINRHLAVLRVPTGLDTDEAIARLTAHPSVALISRNNPISHLPARQWAYDRDVLNPDGLWMRRVDASGLLVAVLDTGIDYTHPALAGRVFAGYNFKDGNDDIMDRDGHGTHVAGIIGASSRPNGEVSGVTPDVRLLAVKIMDARGGSDFAALAGIQYAVDAGAKVINLSFSSPGGSPNPLFTMAADYARSKNALLVAAAGNNRGPVGIPANSPGVLAVSATSMGYNERLAQFSNYGRAIALSAPGDRILSCYPGHGYRTLSGTSMAAPFVSGAAAALWALHPDWTEAQIREGLIQATDDLGTRGWDPLYGYGRLNLSKLR